MHKWTQLLAGAVMRGTAFRTQLKLGQFYRHFSNLANYGDWWFPMSFYIEISEHCNRRCAYCPNARYTRHGQMSNATFDLAVRRLADLNWSGAVGFHMENEPLLDSRLPGFVTRLKQMVPNCDPGLVTNGDYLTEELAADLIARGLFRVTVSRHPPFSASWDERIAGIVSRYPGTVMVIEVGKTWPVHTNGQFPWIKGLPWQGRCHAPSLACVINVHGDVALCCSDYLRRATYGNIAEQTLREIWFGDEFARVRRALRQGAQAHAICAGCSGVVG